MRAEGGAIEKVRISGSSVEIRTINNEPPVGICGSGILDVIAQLRKAGIIDRMGKMLSHPLNNAAGTGAKLALLSKDQRELSKAIARKANYIELTNHPQYLRKFSRAIRLPV